jgi:hypothetical protein
MTSNPLRAGAGRPVQDLEDPLELTSDQVLAPDSFDEATWEDQAREERDAGGRRVLGGMLILSAALWLAFGAWSAGQRLIGQPILTPALAEWVAIVAGPLALFGLLWLTFGRTRRKEAERFTRSVVQMRTEARSLEALLAVLSQRIHDSCTELGAMTQHLMALGDEATTKLGGITKEFDSSSERLRGHGEALDRAAHAARIDIGVLLDDLPRAEDIARNLGEQLRAIGSESANRSDQYGRQIATLTEQSRIADDLISAASARLAARLSEIEQSSIAAKASIDESEAGIKGALDTLLSGTSQALHEIRSGIDIQAEAVSALVDRASVGIGQAGSDAAQSLASHVAAADTSLAGMADRIAERETASKKMLSEIESGLALIDQRFTELAHNGDARAHHFLESLTRARDELDTLSLSASAQDDAIGVLADRTVMLRGTIDGLLDVVRRELGQAIGETDAATQALAGSASAVRPEIEWIRDAAVEAAERMSASNQDIAAQEDRLAALLATVDEGVAGAQSRLSELASLIVQVEREASGLSNETGPALVASLIQVKEAASHAAERAREAIEAVIPASAGKLSGEIAAALERVIRESVEERLRGVEAVAAQAVEAARAASLRLTDQMLSLGQTASALETHMEQVSAEQREKDSEAFARRVSILIDSMHSAAIDVGKILADEIDDKAWAEYMKGNRGVFTRRAVRLMGGSEARPIRVHYDSDPEFRRSVDRYIADYEAMLRRVLAEREGGMMAVALMSSDMGKLYAALSEAHKRK